MLRFFRQIRQSLLTDNKFSKYLLYAVGEILLVVIGILIALNIDNWNSKRIEQQRIAKYYSELIFEFNGISNAVESELSKENDFIIQELKELLEILEKRPSGIQDSLIQLIPILFDEPNIRLVSPISNEFLESGLFTQQADTTKTMLINHLINLNWINQLGQQAQEQFNSNIEPFLLKYIDYAVADNPNPGELFFYGSPDIEQLSNSLEFRNIIRLRLRTHYKIRKALLAYARNTTQYRNHLKILLERNP